MGDDCDYRRGSAKENERVEEVLEIDAHRIVKPNNEKKELGGPA
jgi:hypothetical protein